MTTVKYGDAQKPTHVEDAGGPRHDDKPQHVPGQNPQVPQQPQQNPTPANPTPEQQPGPQQQ